MDQKNETMPFVSIIIVNYNAKPFLKRCLESVLNNDYPNFEVIFVDNKSTDQSIDYVKQIFGNDSRLKIISLDRNYGFSGGNNIGSRYVNKNAKYLVFLDADTEVRRDWLKELVKVMESDVTIGIAQSLILDYISRNSVQSAGLYMIDLCGWTWNLYKGLSYDQFINNNDNNLIEIFAAMGASMIIRYALFKQIGSFDSKMFIYFDEVDLAWRVWLSGYRVVLAPKSIAYHFGSGSGSSARLTKAKNGV